MMCTNIGDEKVVKKLCVRLKEGEVCFKTKTNWRISTAYTEGLSRVIVCTYVDLQVACLKAEPISVFFISNLFFLRFKHTKNLIRILCFRHFCTKGVSVRIWN